MFLSGGPVACIERSEIRAFSSTLSAAPGFRSAQSRLRSAAAQLPLHALVEALDADHDALMRAAADRLALVVRFHAKADGAAFDFRDLCRRDDTQADRRRRDVADIEMDAEALMAGGQEMLDRLGRGSLDQVDHHRRPQHRYPTGAGEWCRMLGSDDEGDVAGEAGPDAGEV